MFESPLNIKVAGSPFKPLQFPFRWAIVVNPLESKLAKRTSVHWSKIYSTFIVFPIQISSFKSIFDKIKRFKHYLKVATLIYVDFANFDCHGKFEKNVKEEKS